MMVGSMSIDLNEIKKLERDLKLIMQEAPILGEKVRKRLAKRAKELAKANVQPRWPGSTGNLKSNIIYRKESNTSTMLIAQTPYAGYVELGTKKHAIPNNPAWGLIGRIHPGAKAMRFMEKAYFQVLAESDALLQDEVNKYFSKRRL